MSQFKFNLVSHRDSFIPKLLVAYPILKSILENKFICILPALSFWVLQSLISINVIFSLCFLISVYFSFLRFLFLHYGYEYYSFYLTLIQLHIHLHFLIILFQFHIGFYHQFLNFIIFLRLQEDHLYLS